MISMKVKKHLNMTTLYDFSMEVNQNISGKDA